MKVDIININPKDLISYENNNKTHWEKQIDLLANSIKEYGFNSPVVIDKNNVIIAWHGRVLASQKLWLDNIPCIVKDNLTEIQIKKYRLLDNKIAELAEDNTDAIRLELEELQDLELDELYLEIDLDDIDFDSIEWNEDREVSDKTKEVECPHCWEKFNI